MKCFVIIKYCGRRYLPNLKMSIYHKVNLNCILAPLFDRFLMGANMLIISV